VTEIPEHLLKRSQAARSKAGGEAPAADAAPAASAPATVGSTAPAPAAPAAPARQAAAPAAPPPPKPDPPYVAAAKQRKKIPFWAMATLSFLPLWVFMYGRGLTPTEQVAAGPVGEGAEIYGSSGCAGCHGGGGEGGLGYQFSAGEVLKTFPHIEDQLAFVYHGTQGYAAAGIDVYGNPEREGGPHITGARGLMPAQEGVLSEAEILAVVCHERYTLGGADPTGEYLEEYETWCSPEAEAWVGFEGGTLNFGTSADVLEGTLEIGTDPRPGSPPSAP